MGNKDIKCMTPDMMTNFRNKFNVIRKEQGKRITYLRQNESDKQYAIKEFLLSSDIQKQLFFQIITKKKENNHQNLISFEQIYKIQEEINYQKYWLLFSYSFKSLKQEIEQRQLLRERFTEPEIWSMLYSCVKALHYLKIKHIVYDIVIPENILINKDGNILLNDPWLNQIELAQNFIRNDDRIHQYLSPQLKNKNLKCFNDKTSESINIFALGISILEAIRIISYKQKIKLNQKSINKQIQLIKPQFSNQLKLVIRGMTMSDSSQRITYQEIINFIETQDMQILKRYIVEETKIEDRSFSKQLQYNSKYKLMQNSLRPNYYDSLTKKDNNLQTQSTDFKNKRNENVPYNYFLSPINFNSYNSINLDKQNKNFQSAYNSQTNFKNLTKISKSSIVNDNPINAILYSPIPLDFEQSSSKKKQSLTQKQKFMNNINKKYDILEFTNNTPNLSLNLSFQELGNKYEQKISPITQNQQMTYQPIMYKSQFNIDNQKSPIHQQLILNNNFQDNIFKYQKQSQEKVAAKKVSSIPEVQQSSNIEENIVQNVLNKFIQEERYQGEIKNGKKDGYGIFYEATGGYYSGEWKNNKMHGYGKLYNQKNILIYDGNWSENKFNGIGKMYNSNYQLFYSSINYRNLHQIGDSWLYYQGNFKQHHKHGQGTIYFTNGEIFRGNFIEDQIEGRGRYETVDWKQILGVWKNNKLIQ